MKKIGTALMIALFVPALVGQIKVPRQERDRIIYDYANILDAEQEDDIRKVTWPLFKAKLPIIIMTVQKLEDYGAKPEDIERLARLTYNQWGIGSTTSGNMGALVLVSKGDRKIWIEIGEGVTRYRGDQLPSIINDVITPNFKENDFAGGLL